jgi:hypothetical protein
VRTFDGTMNHLDDPTWGAAGTPLPRMAPAVYPGDGTGASFAGGPGMPSSLPSPREVSNSLMKAPTGSPSNTHRLTNMVWQWGQFLDHDISLVKTSHLATEAAPIVVAASDPLAPAIPFQRSEFVADGQGVRQQVNSITSYIDASQVYGSDASRAAALRGPGGRLRTSAGDLLPFNLDALPNASLPGQDPTMLFLAGDIRANEQVGLTAMHTLFVREHNRLVGALSANQPLWSDEELFQTARKIVGAEMQAITYGEFLPAILGPSTAHEVDPFDQRYDPSVRPDVANEFATAIYRFGHSMLPTNLKMPAMSGADEDLMLLRHGFFSTTFYAGDADGSTRHLDQMLLGLTSTPAMEIDAMLAEDVREFLFGPPGAGGMDLAALNIHRGRDHGLPAYNAVRQAYGLAAAASFAEVTSSPEFQEILSNLYGSVDQMDAWVGGLAEDHHGDAAFGELIHTALIEQFTRLRDGDRLFFTSDDELMDNPAVSAVIDLEQVTLADIIGWNTGVGSLPSSVFLMVPEPTAMGLLCIAIGSLVCRRKKA